jgi:hypothetical protein
MVLPGTVCASSSSIAVATGGLEKQKAKMNLSSRHRAKPATTRSETETGIDDKFQKTHSYLPPATTRRLELVAKSIKS